MTVNFNDLSWHDASLKYIYIDRQRPGEQDVVKLLINWPENKDSSVIEFYDCYGLNVTMNFGIIACESILTAECLTNSQELNFIRKNWLKANINLESLNHFKIITNSTNSTINILL